MECTCIYTYGGIYGRWDMKYRRGGYIDKGDIHRKKQIHFGEYTQRSVQIGASAS